jgi:acetyl/propionyl-CoA carboxylase alpha subunit
VRGHAVECRLYAEDPDNNFFPCTGRVLTWRPAAIAGVRYDGGIRSGMHRLRARSITHDTHAQLTAPLHAGSEITVYYDPLICKIIAHAPTREEVRAIANVAPSNERLSLRGHAVVLTANERTGARQDDQGAA